MALVKHFSITAWRAEWQQSGKKRIEAVELGIFAVVFASFWITL